MKKLLKLCGAKNMTKSKFIVATEEISSGGKRFIINEVVEERPFPHQHFGVVVDSVMSCCGLRQVQAFYMRRRYEGNPLEYVEIPEKIWKKFYQELTKPPVSNIGHIIFLLNQTQMQHTYAKKFIEITGARVLEQYKSHTTGNLLTIFRADLKGKKYPTTNKSGENNG